jgi:hypothetical protein
MQKIALCAILGNEEKTVERFMRSFAPLVDVFVFVRACGDAEPDRTISVAVVVARDLGISLRLGEYKNIAKGFKHVDHFGRARQVTWNVAQAEKPDWLMWADADDDITPASVEAIRNAVEAVKEDVILVPYDVRNGKQIVVRERLVRNTGDSYWRFAIHEQLGFARDVKYRVADAVILHAPQPDKPVDPERNENILNAELQDTARNLFYVHMEHFERGRVELARMWGATALDFPGQATMEKYEIHVNLSQICRTLEEGISHARAAYALSPDRREALALLVNFELIRGNYYEAHNLARSMMIIEVPKRAYSFLNLEWYGWKGLYLYTHTLRRIGKVAEADAFEEKNIGHDPKFSIIHGTYKRPEQALAIREMWLSYAEDPMSVEYIFGLHHDDPASEKLLGGYRHTVTDKEGCCPNALATMRASHGKFVMVVADDLIPFPGWDKALRVELAKNNVTGFAYGLPYNATNRHVVLNFNDGWRTDGHMCHAFMSRDWMWDNVLSDPWPGTGMFSDNEFTHRARKAGVVIEAPHLLFEHRHVLNGKAPDDETYQSQNALENYTEGLKLFKERNPDVVD